MELREELGKCFDEEHGSLPAPRLCPECRYRRRLANRNEWAMYHRKCSATSRQIIAIYPANSKVPVYDSKYWWSTAWDPLDYGQEIDFSRPFFEQYAELRQRVPRLCITNSQSENSIYTNQASHNNDCSMIIASNHNKLCFFGNWFQHCNNCLDSYSLERSDNCYECTQCSDLSRCAYLSHCSSCKDSWFCSDCHDSEFLFGCHGLKDKRFCLFNQQVTEVEWREYVENREHTEVSIKEALLEKTKLALTYPYPQYFGNASQDVSGDDLKNCHSTYNAFNCRNCLDLDAAQDAWQSRRGFDQTETLDIELSGELEGCAYTSQSFSLSKSWNISHSLYSELCFDSSNIFGSIALRNKQFCILNVEYSEAEYLKLRKRLIKHLVDTNAWGEFFPEHISLFGYNETVAQEYFPLEASDVMAKGWRWFNAPDKSKEYFGAKTHPPDTISNTTDELTQKILLCSQTNQPYRILKEELDFYRKMKLPVPTICPDARRANRLAERNPRKLWPRRCQNENDSGKRCETLFESSISPNRPERVFCLDCYQRTL